VSTTGVPAIPIGTAMLLPERVLGAKPWPASEVYQSGFAAEPFCKRSPSPKQKSFIISRSSNQSESMRLILMRTSVENPVLHNKDTSSYRPGLGMCDDV
jgi:hypothetical protein